MYLLSYRSQLQKCDDSEIYVVRSKTVVYEPQTSLALLFTLFEVMCALKLDRCKEKKNLFVFCNKQILKKKKTWPALVKFNLTINISEWVQLQIPVFSGSLHASDCGKFTLK